jgi:hypothetical protein
MGNMGNLTLNDSSHTGWRVQARLARNGLQDRSDELLERSMTTMASMAWIIHWMCTRQSLCGAQALKKIFPTSYQR